MSFRDDVLKLYYHYCYHKLVNEKNLDIFLILCFMLASKLF
jgi:hypothetical protein